MTYAFTSQGCDEKLILQSAAHFGLTTLGKVMFVFSLAFLMDINLNEV